MKKKLENAIRDAEYCEGNFDFHLGFYAVYYGVKLEEITTSYFVSRGSLETGYSYAQFEKRKVDELESLFKAGKGKIEAMRFIVGAYDELASSDICKEGTLKSDMLKQFEVYVLERFDTFVFDYIKD